MNQRIAIPSSEGTLWQHFGKAPQVTIFDVEDGKIVDSNPRITTPSAQTRPSSSSCMVPASVVTTSIAYAVMGHWMP